MANSFKTFLKHTAKDFHNQSVNPPIVRASTIIFKSMNDIRKTQAKYKKDPRGGHFDYGRQGTSTTHILQKILSKLEESYHTFLTPTGFGSVFLAIFSILRPGDEILTIDPVYNPTRMSCVYRGTLVVRAAGLVFLREKKLRGAQNGKWRFKKL